MDRIVFAPRTFPSFAALRQRGVTLIVSVVLLLLLSVIVLLATNVGLQEQRTSGNDFRAKLVHGAAEASLNYAGEFFRQNTARLFSTTGIWQPCLPADAFPCDVLLDNTGARQANTLRYTGALQIPAGALNANAAGALNLSGFQTNVLLGVVMCRLAQGGPPNTCTTAAGAPGTSVLSIVARAQIPGESASTTLVQSITAFSKLNSATNVPPIASAGSVDVTGSLDIVTNPNAAGPGVPVSVWTRKDVAKTGSPTTCYLDEFTRFGAQGSTTPHFCDSSDGGCSTLNTDIILCDSCRCPADETNGLSFSRAGNTCGEGIDILDIDPVGQECGPNKNVKPNEFPCDLFEFVFGVKSHTDTNPVDNFCETLVKTADPDDSTKQIGVDELFLRQNANVIVDSAGKCDKLNENTRGLVWIKTGIDCNNVTQIGTAEHPVVVVEDGDAKYGARFRLFGLLFVRATADPLDAETGGNATLDFQGRGVVYGSAVVQGKVSKINGTAAFVNNQTILQNLLKEPELQAFGPMPGSWTDRFSY